eukprot:7255-Pelagococcus_subviridis.AAC.1
MGEKQTFATNAPESRSPRTCAGGCLSPGTRRTSTSAGATVSSRASTRRTLPRDRRLCTRP